MAVKTAVTLEGYIAMDFITGTLLLFILSIELLLLDTSVLPVKKLTPYYQAS